MQKLSGLHNSSVALMSLSVLYCHWKITLLRIMARVIFLKMATQRLACRTVLFRQSNPNRFSYIFLHILNIIVAKRQTNSNYMTNPLTSLDLVRQNERLNKELIDIKEELYHVYQENLKLKGVVGRYEKEKEFYGSCEVELARLKNLMRQMGQKKVQMPTEREEVKDRIIMKLQDELISTKIELKETRFQLNRLSRTQ